MTVSFSTATIDRRSQLTYWREVVCATFVRLDVELPPQPSAGFRAHVTAQSLGHMRVAVVVSQPHAVVRSPEMIRRWAEDDFLVNLAIRGRAVVAQDGREATLDPGDFTVFDSARPYRIACPDPFCLLVLKIPRDLFVSHCQLAPGVTASAVRGDRGVGALFSSLLRSLPAHAQGLPPGVVGQVGVNVLEVLATVMSDLAGSSRPAVPREAQLLRARRYITEHLGDPDLAPPTVAQALGVSVRYLHLLFQGESTSPFRWIVEQRLELAARLLANPRQASRTITDIAFGVGFKDTSHFSRAFKQRYGIGPREYRRQGWNGTPP